MAERAGFEPAVPKGTRAFQARLFDRSSTSPERDRSIQVNNQVNNIVTYGIKDLIPTEGIF